jgi:hypothetical protein
MADDRPVELSGCHDCREEVREEASSLLRRYFRKICGDRQAPAGGQR